MCRQLSKKNAELPNGQTTLALTSPVAQGPLLHLTRFRERPDRPPFPGFEGALVRIDLETQRVYPGYTFLEFGAKPMENSGFRIRIDRELRDQFVAACKARDQTASQVLRAYMRDYVESATEVAQKELFPGTYSIQQDEDRRDGQASTGGHTVAG